MALLQLLLKCGHVFKYAWPFAGANPCGRFLDQRGKVSWRPVGFFYLTHCDPTENQSSCFCAIPKGCHPEFVLNAVKDLAKVADRSPYNPTRV